MLAFLDGICLKKFFVSWATSKGGYIMYSQDSFQQFAIRTQEHANEVAISVNGQIAVAQEKARLQKEIDENRERLYRERDGKTTSTIINANKQFILVHSYPTGKDIYTPPIMDAHNLKVRKMFSVYNQIINVIWELRCNDWDSPLYIEDRDFNSTNFVKYLNAKGEVLKVEKNQKKMVCDLIINYLKSNAIDCEIPQFYGWNRMSNGEWYFESDQTKTMEGLLL